MIDVQKSSFQVSKMQKMNIMKQPLNKYITEYSFNIWIEQFCTNERLFYSPWVIAD